MKCMSLLFCVADRLACLAYERGPALAVPTSLSQNRLSFAMSITGEHRGRTDLLI